MEQQLRKSITKLENIYTNFKKSPNRSYLRKTLLDKHRQARKIYETISYLVSERPDLKSYLYEAKNLYSAINLFIEAKLKTTNYVIKFRTVVKIIINFLGVYRRIKMANPKVDIKLGTAIIQVYDGNLDGLSSFIDSVMLFNDTVSADFELATPAQKTAAVATVLRFIKTRLIGKARVVVGENPVDTNEIITKLKDRCGKTKSPDVLVAKLKEAKQTGEINKFTSEIEGLVLLLEKAYISEDIPIETATKMATKQGVKALCSGVRSTETKLLLKAGQFTTLNSAIEKVIENEASSSSVSHNSQIMYTNRGNALRGRGNIQTRGGRGYHGYNNFGNRGGFYHHRGRGNFQQNHNTPNYQNTRGRRSRGNYQNTRNNHIHGFIQPRIFYTNAEVGQGMMAPVPHNAQDVQNWNQCQQPSFQFQHQQQHQHVQQQPQSQQQQQNNFLGQLRSYAP